ncbi:MAG: F0F1 ATP synthase subunit delta [Nocardioides sp.]
MCQVKQRARYAKSLIDLSIEQNALEDLFKDMMLFEEVVDDNSELEAILKNPIVPLDKKAGILKTLFGSKVHQITQDFFKLSVAKGHSAILSMQLNSL